MKPKKTTRADLRSRRVIFLEIGFIVALAAAIFVFSIGQSEKALKDYTEIYDNPGYDLPPIPTKPDEPVKMKPQMPKFIAAGINVVDNNRKIVDPGWIFDPDEFGDSPVVPAPGPEEPEDGDIPLIFAEEMPSFQGGGLEDFRKWVFSQIMYPRAALENGIQGRVVVRFVIERDGSLTNIEVDLAPDRSLADETVRVLKHSPKWTPGKQRNKPVRVLFVLPVEYRIGY